MKKYFYLILLVFIPNRIEAQIISESFEIWDDTLGVLTPNGWTPWPAIDSTLLNIERVEHINDGEYAVNLKSNVPFFEGNLITYLDKDLPVWPNLVKVKFTYICKGEGSCRITLGQSDINSTGINHKLLWQAQASEDTMSYSVTIDSFQVSPNADVFKNISLRARPIIEANGQFGICDFTVDSITIEVLDYPTSVSNVQIENKLILYPNPTKDELYLKFSQDINISEIEVSLFQSNGLLIKKNCSTKKMDLTKYPPGVYYLYVKYSNDFICRKIVKLKK